MGYVLNDFSTNLQIVVLARQPSRELILLAPVCQDISQKGGKRSPPFSPAIWGMCLRRNPQKTPEQVYEEITKRMDEDWKKLIGSAEKKRY